MFYNTTNKTGKALKKAVKKTKGQKQIIIEYMVEHRKASASQLFKKRLFHKKSPITSYRRTLSDLTYKDEMLIKTDIMVMGLYGDFEHIYKIK